MQRRKEKRQRGLGDTGTRLRKGGRERLELLAVRERGDERVQYWPVHDERRETRPARTSV